MIVVGLGEYAISSDCEEELITYSLGSCVALILRCPSSYKTAMAHIVLPRADRSDHFEMLDKKPGYFANVIVPKLIDLFIKDYACNAYNIEAYMIGGATSQVLNDVFQIGAKNIEEIQKILQCYQLELKKIDVGGYYSRTVKVDVGSGSIQITKNRMII